MKFLGVALFICASAYADLAPPAMHEFNKTCPTPKACAEVTAALDACKKKNLKSCEDFVAGFEKLLPTYDCQRSFDATANGNYIVPAIWLCQNQEKLVRFLSKLKTESARHLFASPEFRRSLDGSLAEEFGPKSKAAAKALKKAD